jgi:hypothetical protein
MANSGCSLPSRWNMLDAAPAYSTFAGVLGGFLFLGIITLLSVRRDQDSSSGEADRETDKPEGGKGTQGGIQRVDRSRTLMLFLPALLCLLVSSFGFGEASGDQVCVRGYVGGMFASSLLAVGALAVFCGIAWMIDAYGVDDEQLRRAAAIFIYVSYAVIIASLLAGAVDLIDNAFDNKLPGYVQVLLVLYVLLLLISAVVTRKKWFIRHGDGAVAQLAAVYFPTAYLVIIVIIEAVLNTYGPVEWRSFNDWKVYLTLSVSMFFPALTMIAYTRALPEVQFRKPKHIHAASGHHRESNSSPAGSGRMPDHIFSREKSTVRSVE